MKRKLIYPAAVLLALSFATQAEAGPIRNVLGRLRGVVKRVVKAPAKLVRGSCGAASGRAVASGACANGQCAK